MPIVGSDLGWGLTYYYINQVRVNSSNFKVTMLVALNTGLAVYIISRGWRKI